MRVSSADQKSTQAFYEEEAKRYPLIHARPVQQYSAAFEAELMAPHIGTSDCCLDVGCGEGRTARKLASVSGRTVVGLDFSLQMLHVAKRLAPDDAVRYCAGDAMGLPFARATFDVAVAVTSLNNVPDLATSLAEMSRVLKPNGRAILLVINSRELAAPLRGIYFFPFYLWRWMRGGKRYRSLVYSRRELVAALPPDLRVERLQGMRLLPDLIPEWPFNFHSTFAPAFHRMLRWLAPADRWLCAHPLFGQFARFHFLVAIKSQDNA
jgi:ubiquinone/menaquinone biosynthesis C-methylase UbiE